jgi:ABC-type multidrug transport system permease subunit
MVKKIITIVKKNLKLITRTKSSALIVIFGPLLLILLIGAAFNTANIYGIRVGTYSQSYSSLTNAVIDELHKKRFSTVQIESQEVCIESVRNGIIHVCAIFPPNLAIQEGGDITFYVDNSRLNLVYIVLDTLSTIVGSKSKELSTQLTKTIIDALDTADKELKGQQPVLATLTQDTAATEQKITALKLDVEAADFSIPASSIPSLESEASRLSTGNNSTDTLTGLVAQVKREIQERDDKLNLAANKQLKIKNDLTTVSQLLRGNLNYVSAIGSAADKILADIRNVKTTSITKIVSPLTTKIEPIAREKTHLNYVFPTLVVLIIMFVSMMLASTLEIKEKTARVYFKNFITPTSDYTFMISNFITNMIIVVLQIAVLFGVAFYFFKDHLLGMMQNVIIIPLLIATVFILLGMVIGNLFRSEETATLAVISFGFIFLFFSSAILPIETLPEVIRKVAEYNPFFIGERLLNKVLLFESPLKPLMSSLYVIGGYIIGLGVLAIATKKIAKRRL